MKSDSRFESLLTHIVSIEERDQVLGILVSVKGAPTNAQIQRGMIYIGLFQIFFLTTRRKKRAWNSLTH
jgi:hypothetical protein